MGLARFTLLLGHWLLAGLLALGSSGLERLAGLMPMPACGCCSGSMEGPDGARASCCAARAAARGPRATQRPRACSCALTRAPAPGRASTRAPDARGARTQLELGMKSSARVVVRVIELPGELDLARPISASAAGPPGSWRSSGGQRAAAIGTARL